ncbi:MAG: sigma-70 family RNA polymerase sigma factor [Deferribacterota bacterium]|nr:sigma-70 family RNA polymerase sigma factor [Deferribacterota bacterium]
MDDISIIEEVLEGKYEYYEYLVLKYQNRLYAFIISLVKNEEEAKDIVQESFVTAYNKLSDLVDRRRFYPWLKKIAFHNALLFLNKDKKKVKSDEDVLDYLDNLDNNYKSSVIYVKEKSPEAHILNKEISKYVKLFIDSLPDKLRIVVILRDVEGHSYEEIAQLLDIPIGTVRSRLHSAREVLKERLIKQGIADERRALS